MVYVEYVWQKNKYQQMQNRYEDLLNEKEAIFSKTQPKGISYDKEKVNGGTQSNVFDNYLAEMEAKKIDERLHAMKKMLEDREVLLSMKYEELKRSNEVCDIVYRMKYIECRKNREIAKIIHYSETQLYRVLNDIMKNIAEV